MRLVRFYFRPFHKPLAEAYGKAAGEAITRDAIGRFEVLLPDIPYIGGGKNSGCSAAVAHMSWEPFGLERRRLRHPKRGGRSGAGLDYCAVRERGPDLRDPTSLPGYPPAIGSALLCARSKPCLILS